MRHAAAEIDGLSAAARQVRALAVAAAAAAAGRGTIDLARGRSDARFRCCPHGAAHPPHRRVPRLASPGNDDTGTGIAEREPESYFGLDNAHDGPRTSVAGP